MASCASNRRSTRAELLAGWDVWVDLAGLEPTAPCLQDRRSTYDELQAQEMVAGSGAAPDRSAYEAVLSAGSPATTRFGDRPVTLRCLGGHDPALYF